MATLGREEAAGRADLLDVNSYDIDLDLTTGDERFGSRTVVRFGCRRPGEETFIELAADSVSAIRLNGRSLDPTAVVVGDRIRLSGLAAENELVVTAECGYSRTGEGLHRFVDPADGLVYLYSHAPLYEAHRMFACFDQPDLKAVVRLNVAAPPGWQVVANGAGVQESPGRWAFAATRPLPTYVVAVAAGPYHQVQSHHGDVPLGLYCRQELAEHLPAEEIFAYTTAFLDYYADLFGRAYPFGKYDQLFVPEFNLGAMENPGCVTFREEAFVHRSKITAVEHERLAIVIAHEMAHMWFGNLVTMRWWDDLWLNESFAEYMGYRATAAVTGHRDAWVSFSVSRKGGGLRQDQLPTTHPVAGSAAADTDEANLNFDGISYAKGAAVLRQLVAWVGDDAFLAGLRHYFDRHAYGTAELADLLAALSAAGGRDLAGWAERWLRTSGADTLTPELRLGADGRYAEAAVLRTGGGGSSRPHRFAVAGYVAAGPGPGDPLVERLRVDVAVQDGRQPVPALVGAPACDLLLLNADDATYAKVRFDDRSLAAVVAGVDRLADPLARAVCWAALWDLVRDGEFPPRRYVGLVAGAAVGEPNVVVLQQLLDTAALAADRYLGPAERAAARATLAGAALAGLAGDPGGDRQLHFARAYATVARAPVELDRLAGWLAGREVPAGLHVDRELRWHLVRRLAVAGRVGPDLLAAEQAADPGQYGRLAARWAAAARPDAAAKEAAWTLLTTAAGHSNHELQATARGFWQPDQADLLLPHVERYFAALPRLTAGASPAIVQVLAESLYPAAIVEEETLQASRALLERGVLVPPAARLVLEGQDEVARALRIRAAAPS